MVLALIIAGNPNSFTTTGRAFHISCKASNLYFSLTWPLIWSFTSTPPIPTNCPSGTSRRVSFSGVSCWILLNNSWSSKSRFARFPESTRAGIFVLFILIRQNVFTSCACSAAIILSCSAATGRRQAPAPTGFLNQIPIESPDHSRDLDRSLPLAHFPRLDHLPSFLEKDIAQRSVQYRHNFCT